MSREFGVKWAAIPVLSEISRSAASKWVSRSLASARNAARSVKEKNELERIKAGEFEGLQFQINGEKITSPEGILEKHRTSFLYHSGM